MRNEDYSRLISVALPIITMKRKKDLHMYTLMKRWSKAGNAGQIYKNCGLAGQEEAEVPRFLFCYF